jgi:hypothetical protein
MSDFDPVKFVEWAVWYANERGANLTPIRIVKFLYLVDLYNARVSAGKELLAGNGSSFTMDHSAGRLLMRSTQQRPKE